MAHVECSVSSPGLRNEDERTISLEMWVWDSTVFHRVTLLLPPLSINLPTPDNYRTGDYTVTHSCTILGA